MTRTGKIYYWIVGALLVILGTTVTYQVVLSLTEDKGMTLDIQSEYLGLFNDTVKKQITDPISYNNKHRNPITLLNYHNGIYTLVVYKISTEGNFNIKNIRVRNDGNVYSSVQVYSVAANGLTDINYIPGGQDIAQSIFLTLTGDNITKILENNQEIAYHLNYKSISISYNDADATVDMYSRNESSLRIPASLMITKRKNGLYLLLMSVNSPKQDLDPKLLLTLLK